MNTAELKQLSKDTAAMADIHSKTSFLNAAATLRQRLWHIETNQFSVPLCKTCNITPVKWFTKELTYRMFCSSKCAHADSATKEKREATCLEKYGFKSNLSNQTNQQKQKETCLKKYGVDNFSKSEEFNLSYTKTCLDRYGVTNPSKLNSVKSKIDDTHFEKYGRLRSSQSHISTNIINLKNNESLMRQWFDIDKMPVSEIAERLGVNHSQLCVHFKNNLNIDIHRHCVSKTERDIGNYLTSLDVEYESSNRTIIKPKELDIVVHSHNVAIEINGTYWHGELTGKSKFYHLNKLTECNNQNIRLIQVLDTEWNTKQEIVKSRLSNVFGKNNKIWARNCTIKLVDTLTATQFFNTSHIQGACVHSLAYGLYYNEMLVAVMTFGKSRYNKNYQWELIRYANALYTNVIGGAGKLFKHFLRTQQPTSIISYCDLRWNTGTVYEKLGFSNVAQSEPNYWYFKPGYQLESRVKFQKHKLKNLLEYFDPSLTEWDNMQNNGYDRIWDCGNLIFTYGNTKC